MIKNDVGGGICAGGGCIEIFHDDRQQYNKQWNCENTIDIVR